MTTGAAQDKELNAISKYIMDDSLQSPNDISKRSLDDIKKQSNSFGHNH